MDPVEKAGRRKSRRPRVIAAGVVYMLLSSTIAVVLAVVLLAQINENHVAQLKETALLQEHSQLLHTYENAATGIDQAGLVIAHNETLICGALHLACVPVVQPAKP